MEKKWGQRAERFQDMDIRKIKQLIGTKPEELTKDDLIEMNASEPVPENKVTSGNLGSKLFKTTFDFFYNMSPFMIQALKLKQTVEGLGTM